MIIHKASTRWILSLCSGRLGCRSARFSGIFILIFDTAQNLAYLDSFARNKHTYIILQVRRGARRGRRMNFQIRCTFIQDHAHVDIHIFSGSWIWDCPYCPDFINSFTIHHCRNHNPPFTLISQCSCRR